MLKRSPLSLVDDIGTVYLGKEKVVRTINAPAEEKVKKLLNSGLINELTKLGLFPRTWISDTCVDKSNLVLEHEKIDVLTYPYEWSPEMLRRAALCILTVAEVSERFGYMLKDAHPYNVLYSKNGPIFIDFGSFVECNDRKEWVARHEFYYAFYLPLKIYEMGLRDTFSKLFIKNGTGMPVSEYIRVKHPISASIGVPSLQTFVQGWFYFRKVMLDPWKDDTRLNKVYRNILYLLRKTGIKYVLFIRAGDYRKLKNMVRRVNLKGRTQWGNYHVDAKLLNNAGEVSLSDRFNTILGTIRKIKPEVVLEVACNQGALSNEIAKLDFIKKVICTDYDEVAIDGLIKNFHAGHTKLIPAVMNFMYPLGNLLTTSPQERFKADMVVALAITHHLILTQKMDLKCIIEKLFTFNNKYLLIEFMPLGLWDGRHSTDIPSWYNIEWFEKGLSQFCIVNERLQYERNRILFVCERKVVSY